MGIEKFIQQYSIEKYCSPHGNVNIATEAFKHGLTIAVLFGEWVEEGIIKDGGMLKRKNSSIYFKNIEEAFIYFIEEIYEQ